MSYCIVVKDTINQYIIINTPGIILSKDKTSILLIEKNSRERGHA